MKENFKELVIKPFDIVDVVNGNYAEVEKSLKLVLKKYQTIEFAETDLIDAKNVRAKLNGFKKVMDDQRKDVKKKLLEPYTPFEEKIKSLIALVEEPRLYIDEQVKGFEQNQKDAKEKLIDSLVEARNKDLQIDPNLIKQDTWLNAGCVVSKIKKEIEAVFEAIEKDLRAVETLNSEFVDDLKKIILGGGDINDVLSEKARMDAVRDKVLEPKKEAAAPVSAPVSKTVSSRVEKEISFDIRLTCTKTKKEKLKDFMKENSIKFEQI